MPVAEKSFRIRWAPCRGSFSSIESMSPASASIAFSSRASSRPGPGGASGFGSSLRPFEMAKADARRARSPRPQRGQAGVLSVATARDRKLITRWQWRQ
jgi:hypothetical protein